jgi:hypothetical protein
MASGSADQALSPDVTSFVICGRTMKLGDQIHSTGIGAIEKKRSIHLAMLSPPPESKESLWAAVPLRNIV